MITKKVLYKYTPLNDNIKESLFARQQVIVQKRVERARDLAILSEPVKVNNWNSGRISNKSWRFSNVNAILDKDGTLRVSGEQSSNRLEGFSGSLLVDLIGANGEVLSTIRTSTTGVNGLDSRMIHYSQEIDQELAAKTKDLKIKAVK